MLTSDFVNPTLSTTWVGRDWHYFAEIDSTNKWMVAHQEQLAHGAVATADCQTAGKGRQGRVWVTPRGQALAVSILFKPQPAWPANHAAWLTMMAGLAAMKGIRQHTGVAVGLKWPNDVVVQDATSWRKVGGILVEGTLAGEHLTTAVVGLGLNVNLAAADLPQTALQATSLLVESGAEVARWPLLHTILQMLEQLYEAAVAGQSPHPAWAAELLTTGQQVVVRTAVGELVAEGVATGVDDIGQLLVRGDNGRLQVIPAGDVSLRIKRDP